jgi:uncharacterized membrane protein YebE (DUF533 family)
MAAKPPPAPDDAAPDGGGESAPRYDPAMLRRLGEQTLRAALAERHAFLAHAGADLRRLDAAQRALFLHAMANAAHAGGLLEERERPRSEATLRRLEAGDDLRVAMRDALDAPRPLLDLLGEVDDMRAAVLVYAASLLAVGEREPVHRHDLQYLCARPALPADVVASLCRGS